MLLEQSLLLFARICFEQRQNKISFQKPFFFLENKTKENKKTTKNPKKQTRKQQQQQKINKKAKTKKQTKQETKKRS